MNTQKYRLVVIWNLVLTTLLIITLAFVAVSVQASNDPPVEVFTASLDHGVGAAGTGTTTDVHVAGTGYTTILSVPVDFTGQNHNHQCFVSGSANVENPATGGKTGFRYDFTTKMDTAVSSFAVMTLEMSDNPSHDDANFFPVTTTRIYTGVSAAAHTFSLVAREQSAANPDMTVTNATITVLCFKKLQTLSTMEDAEPIIESNLPNDK